MSQLIRRHLTVPHLLTAVALFTVFWVSACSGATGVLRQPVRLPSTEADSAGQAQRLADEVVRQLALPPGTHSLSGRPPLATTLSDLVQRAFVKTLVDRHALWVVPLSPAGTIAWIAAHRFKGWSVTVREGWRVNERGEPTRGGGVVYRQVGLVPTQEGGDPLGVLVSAVPGLHGGSLVRADAQVIWYPPRPEDSLIPSSVGQLTIVVAPEGPDGERPGSPRAKTVIVGDPAKVRAIAVGINRLHMDVDTVESCVESSGMYVWLFFRERPGGRQVAEAKATPYECSGGSRVSLRVRGHRSPALGESVKLVDEIERLVGVKLKGL